MFAVSGPLAVLGAKYVTVIKARRSVETSEWERPGMELHLTRLASPATREVKGALVPSGKFPSPAEVLVLKPPTIRMVQTVCCHFQCFENYFTLGRSIQFFLTGSDITNTVQACHAPIKKKFPCFPYALAIFPVFYQQNI